VLVKQIVLSVAKHFGFLTAKEYLEIHLGPILHDWISTDSKKLSFMFPVSLFDYDTWQQFADHYAATLVSQLVYANDSSGVSETAKLLRLDSNKLVSCVTFGITPTSLF